MHLQRLRCEPSCCHKRTTSFTKRSSISAVCVADTAGNLASKGVSAAQRLCTHPIMVACQWKRSSGEVGPARHTRPRQSEVASAPHRHCCCSVSASAEHVCLQYFSAYLQGADPQELSVSTSSCTIRVTYSVATSSLTQRRTSAAGGGRVLLQILQLLRQQTQRTQSALFTVGS